MTVNKAQGQTLNRVEMYRTIAYFFAIGISMWNIPQPLHLTMSGTKMHTK